MHNAETKAPPSQEPRDHRVQAARATFSQIHDTIQKPARRCLVASGKKTLKGETWCESGAKVKRQKLTALRGHSESSHVCFVCHQP